MLTDDERYNVDVELFGGPTNNGDNPAEDDLDLDRLADVLRNIDTMSCVDVALELCDIGNPVVPTVPGDKAPMLTVAHIEGVDPRTGERLAPPCPACKRAGLTPVKDHGGTVDPDLIRLYWTAHPDAGVGMKNHPRLVRGDGDFADAATLRKARQLIGYGQPYGVPEPFAAYTPGGQYRRRFIHTLPDGVNAPGGGTKVLGVSWYSASGYVVVKGRHPNGGDYSPFRGAEITPLPPMVAANIRRDHSCDVAVDAASNGDVAAFLDGHTGTEHLELLARRRKALAATEEGHRHHTAVGMLYGCFRESVAGYYPARLAHDAIRDGLAATNGRLGDEWTSMVAWAVGQVDGLDPAVVRAELTAEQYQRTVDELEAGYPLDYLDLLEAESRHRDMSDDEIDAQIAAMEEAVSDDDRETTWRDHIVDGAAWLRNGSQTVEPVWGDGDTVPMARNQPTILAGGPGAGKTTLAQHVTLGVIGTPGYGTVLGWPVREMPGDATALFLASDRPDQARLSLRRMIDTPEAWGVIERRLRVWQGPPPASIAKRPSLLLEMAGHAGAGFLVVDSLKDMAIGLTEDEVGAAINHAHQLLAANGIDVVSLHHPRKRGRENPDTRWTIDDLYGSAWLAAGVGSVIFLERGPTSTEATQAKSPNGIEPTWRYTLDPTTGRLAAGAIDDVLAAVRDAGPDGISTAHVARWVLQIDKPETSQVEQVRRALKRLEASGAIETTGSGRSTRWVGS